MKLINKKRILLPFPTNIAKVTAAFFELFPHPLLTIDQLNTLKYDNVLSGNLKSNIDIDYNCNLNFKKYSYIIKVINKIVIIV